MDPVLVSPHFSEHSEFILSQTHSRMLLCWFPAKYIKRAVSVPAFLFNQSNLLWEKLNPEVHWIHPHHQSWWLLFSRLPARYLCVIHTVIPWSCPAQASSQTKTLHPKYMVSKCNGCRRQAWQTTLLVAYTKRDIGCGKLEVVMVEIDYDKPRKGVKASTEADYSWNMISGILYKNGGNKV